MLTKQEKRKAMKDFFEFMSDCIKEFEQEPDESEDALEFALDDVLTGFEVNIDAENVKAIDHFKLSFAQQVESLVKKYSFDRV